MLLLATAHVCCARRRLNSLQLRGGSLAQLAACKTLASRSLGTPSRDAIDAPATYARHQMYFLQPESARVIACGRVVERLVGVAGVAAGDASARCRSIERPSPGPPIFAGKSTSAQPPATPTNLHRGCPGKPQASAQVILARSFARPGQACRINTPRRSDVCSVA